jgi:hypothetical protein
MTSICIALPNVAKESTVFVAIAVTFASIFVLNIVLLQKSWQKYKQRQRGLHFPWPPWVTQHK